MKKFLFILSLLFAFNSPAAERITATISFTNTPANADTFTVNGNLRTWKTTVTTPASEIAVTNNAVNSTTNLYTQIAGQPYSGFPDVKYLNATNLTIAANSGSALAVSASGTYVSIVLSTQQVAEAHALLVPHDANATAYYRTNDYSEVVTGINLYPTNAFAEGITALSNYVSLTATQVVSGEKLFSGANTYSNDTQIFSGGIVTNVALKNATEISGTIGGVTNGSWLSPSFTNGQNFGDAFRSPGIEDFTEQFGVNAQAVNEGDNAFGYSATASGGYALALGYFAIAGGFESVAIGGGTTDTNSNLAVAIGWGSFATGFNTLALGQSSFAQAKNATALGSGANSQHTNSTAIGVGSFTTDTNQVFLGQASGTVMIPGGLTVGGVTTNFHMAGTNTLDGTIEFIRKNNTALANGNNASVDISTNLYVKLSGPSASFTINGIAGGRDGRMLILQNSTTFNFVIAHESGVDPTAANRILTRTGADVTVTSTAGPGAATLIYDSALSRWILISTN